MIVLLIRTSSVKTLYPVLQWPRGTKAEEEGDEEEKRDERREARGMERTKDRERDNK